MHNRATGPDLIRISACVFVVLVHTTALMFREFSENWNICAAYNASARLCVPLFFMLSGYFLLNRKIDDIPIFYIGRLHRILFPFFIILFIYYVKLCVLQNDTLPADFINRALTEKIPRGRHLWFVHTLVGIYLTIPFFQYFFSGDYGLKLIKIYLVIWIISYICFPVFVQSKLIPINIFESFHFEFFFGYLGYVLLGGILAKIECKTISIHIWIGLYILASFLIFISTYSYSYNVAHKPSTIFLTDNPFVLLQTVSFFMAFKDIKKESAFVNKLAVHSYWIYLVHILILDQVVQCIPVEKHSLFTIPLIVLLVVTLAFLLSFPMLKFEHTFNRLVFSPCIEKLGKTFNSSVPTP